MITNFTFFKNLSDKCPKILSAVELNKLTIDTTNSVYINTMRSRYMRDIGDNEAAKRWKSSCGAYTPSVICEGGRCAKNIVKLTLCTLVDIDHIPPHMMDDVLCKVRKDKHTFFANVTNSERGVRIISKWVAVDNNGSPYDESFFEWQRSKETQYQFMERVLPYHYAGYANINEYYSSMLNFPYDSKTKDPNRLSFLCHDSKACFNEEAEPFVIYPCDIRHYSVNVPKGIQKAESFIAYGKQKSTAKGGFDNVLDLIESWVSQTTLYQPGSYNRYVSKCGYLLCEFGIDENIALSWAIARFSDYNPREVTSIIHSCYRHGNFDIRTFIHSKK